MSYISISKVNDIKKAVNYVMQDSKTHNGLITTFACCRDSVFESFDKVNKDRELYTGKKTDNRSRMIIQSFDPDDNISYEHAHQLGVEFANRYLKGNHQYIVATHVDTNHVHNHIIFNEVNMNTHNLFDSKRKNTNTLLHSINDDLYKESNLIVIEKGTIKKDSLSQREYIVRAKGQSYKETLENIIDKKIEEVSSLDELIDELKKMNYQVKEGKYLSFKPEESKRFIRAKSLGIHYSEESIKYRIENKHFKFEKIEPILKRQWIDKSDDKFANNRGLSKWASKQNIHHLQELSKLVFEKDMTIGEVKELEDIQEKINSELTSKLDKYDELLFKAKESISSFEDYKDSAELIANYKKATDKSEFKRQHYSEFKKYDLAKKNLAYLRKHLNINSPEELREYVKRLLDERNLLYKSYTEVINKKQEHMAKIKKTISL
ncbi:relaxase/mobilization nuclease domain-containing protein [Erysipelothrix rhusiopathiae]|nr:relaxase/mobilization nuclease domain-containing protein [Erysipelothrix rhusiopathiae]